MKNQAIIQRLLKQHSYTEIAAKMGKTEATIRRWANGTRKPHRLFVREMEKMLEEGKDGNK